MTADLGKYTDLHVFAKEFPNRYYQMGIAERLLFGAASGIARKGLPHSSRLMPCLRLAAPTTSSIRRSRKRIATSKYACALPGLTSGYGPSHQAAEDLALFRAMPNMTVIDPCDAYEIEQAVPGDGEPSRSSLHAIVARTGLPLVLDEYGYKFVLGRASLLRDGADVLFVSSGTLTMRALEATRRLQADKTRAAVLHVPTIKPLDTETIVAACRKPGRLVVVAGKSTVIGGLGEAVASALIACVASIRLFSIRSACPTNFSRQGRYQHCTIAMGSRQRRSAPPSRVGGRHSLPDNDRTKKPKGE